VFDLKTLQTLRKINTPGGENPDFITYEPKSQRIFAFNGRSNNASVIEAKADPVSAMIKLTGKPEAAVADGTGALFVDIENTHQLQRIDANKSVVTATLPLTGCTEPAGLAIDLRTRRLFVGCRNQVMVVANADNGAIVATLSIGAGVDNTVFDPATQLIFNAQGDGTLSIIHEQSADRYLSQQTAVTQPSARTLTLNPPMHEIYLVSAEFDELPAEAGQTRPRRSMRPGSFSLLVMAPKAHSQREVSARYKLAK
jgi:DNA-binding beta-propeller fold protein YncE